MGQKVHPMGFRIGIIRDWQSKWYSDKRSTYTELVHEDVRIRRRIERMRDAGVSGVEIDRNANQVSVTIRTSRPGIVIGRQGKNVEDLRKELETLSGKKVRVNIIEINVPELDAHLVARNVADQLERRVAHRRAMKQTAQRTMARGAHGIRIMVGGRLGGSEMSRKDKEMQGRVPLHTMRADIDYGTAEARTTFGQIGVKVWIYKGEILPERSSAAAPQAEEPREGPAPAIAPESVRGPELEAPAPTAETLAQATGQPAPRVRRSRKVEPEAAPGAEAPAGTAGDTGTAQALAEPDAQPVAAPDASAPEDTATVEVEAATTEPESAAAEAIAPETAAVAETAEAAETADVTETPDATETAAEAAPEAAAETETETENKEGAES